MECHKYVVEKDYEFYVIEDSESNDDLPSQEPTNLQTDEELREVWCSKGKSSMKDYAATQCLMELRSAEKYIRRFNDRKSVKLALWKEISQEMKKQGYNVDAEKCRQKYSNLSKKYIAFVRHCTKTGNDKTAPPPFYDLLHKVLGSKDKVNLTDTVDTLVDWRDQTNHSGSQENENTLNNLPHAHSSQQVVTTPTAVPKNEKKIQDPKQKLHKLKTITKADILDKITECNEKVIQTQKENVIQIMEVLKEHNELIKGQMKQRQQLITVFENIANSKKFKKRRHSSSESE